jgi:hypothetical protein
MYCNYRQIILWVTVGLWPFAANNLFVRNKYLRNKYLFFCLLSTSLDPYFNNFHCLDSHKSQLHVVKSVKKIPNRKKPKFV